MTKRLFSNEHLVSNEHRVKRGHYDRQHSKKWVLKEWKLMSARVLIQGNTVFLEGTNSYSLIIKSILPLPEQIWNSAIQRTCLLKQSLFTMLQTLNTNQDMMCRIWHSSLN